MLIRDTTDTRYAYIKFHQLRSRWKCKLAHLGLLRANLNVAASKTKIPTEKNYPVTLIIFGDILWGHCVIA